MKKKTLWKKGGKIMSRAGATRLHGFTANSEVSCCIATPARWLPARASVGSVPKTEVAVATCHLAARTPGLHPSA